MRQEFERHQTWTNHQVAALLQYRASGLTFSQIATRMERSNESVKSMHWRVSKRKVRAITLPPIIETIAIEKALVPDFYVLGWRFSGFSAERLCVMVKETRAPSPEY